MWVLHGYRTLRGKAAFDAEIENDAAVGSFADLFPFNGDRISRLQSFHINLGATLFSVPAG